MSIWTNVVRTASVNKLLMETGDALLNELLGFLLLESNDSTVWSNINKN